MIESEDVFNVKAMNSFFTRLFFENKLKAEAGREGISKLAEALEFIPLAITTVAAQN